MARYEVTVNTFVAGCPGGGCSVRRTVTAADHCAAVEPLLHSLVVDGTYGLWTVRRRGPLGLTRQRWAGQFDRTGGSGGGLSGVREPRRPLPPGPHDSAALDLPAA